MPRETGNSMGRSGYSKSDEKAAKAYGKSDYAATRGTPTPQKEREYRRDIGAPSHYLRNTKTEKGREINKKNVEFIAKEAAANRPPMSKKWTEKP
jgi:hypothetical protein